MQKLDFNKIANCMQLVVITGTLVYFYVENHNSKIHCTPEAAIRGCS